MSMNKFANLLVGLAVALPLCQTSAQAQDYVDARQVNVPTGSSASVCHEIDSRLGWQRVLLDQTLTVGNKITIDVQNGWSVDAANYRGVGIEGHTGVEAERLAPYSQYKFYEQHNFGELLISGTNGVFYSSPQHEFTIRGILGLYFRINDRDEALGDNAGSMRVCVELVP
mgnify:CR=1 FL=1